MTHNKANKSKILMLILGLTMCISLMLGIAMASPTSTVYAEGGTGATGGLIIDGTGNITADGTYAYSAADKTLMLNGYNGGVIRFTADDDVKVNLENGSTNTITLWNTRNRESIRRVCHRQSYRYGYGQGNAQYQLEYQWYG